MKMISSVAIVIYEDKRDMYRFEMKFKADDILSAKRAARKYLKPYYRIISVSLEQKFREEK